MNSIDKRIAELERQTVSADSPFVIVVGEPSQCDIQRIESATTVIHIPDNGRDGERNRKAD